MVDPSVRRIRRPVAGWLIPGCGAIALRLRFYDKGEFHIGSICKATIVPAGWGVDVSSAD